MFSILMNSPPRYRFDVEKLIIAEANLGPRKTWEHSSVQSASLKIKKMSRRA
jgi:hypothetical protein